jgi:methylglutaconyl-CoA hydratase
MSPSLRLDREGRGVARLTLARPEKHNALDPDLMDAITEAVMRLGPDRDVRVVVLAAEGRTFCAGGDLDWMRAQIEADGAAREREARRLAGMLRALDACPSLSSPPSKAQPMAAGSGSSPSATSPWGSRARPSP